MSELNHPGISGLLLHAQYDSPDSPLTGPESVDDWALSSLCPDATSDDEPASSGRPIFIMPRAPQETQLVLRQAEVGRLRVLVGGMPGTGKSQLIDTIARSRAIKRASDLMHLSSTTQEIRMQTEGAPDYNLSFLQTAADLSDLVTSRLEETASLVNGAHPGANLVLAKAPHLEPFPHVDVLVYLFVALPSASELEALKDLSDLTAIIPLIAKSDSMNGVDLFENRVALKRALDDAKIDANYFDDQTLPYAISTLRHVNWDMSASVVEGSGYQSTVLVDSHLSEFIANLVSPASTEALRTKTASLFTRFVQEQQARNTFTQPSPFKQWAIPGVFTDRAVAIPPSRDPAQCKRMTPIGNIDPLDLGKWAQAAGLLVAMALTLAGAGIASNFAASTVVDVPADACSFFSRALWTTPINLAILSPF